MANIFTDNASESAVSELMNVLNLLGNDKLEDNVNRVILGLVSYLSFDKSPDVKKYNILKSVLEVKHKLRDGEAGVEDSVLEYKTIFKLCLSLLERSSNVKGQCFSTLCSVLRQTLLLMGRDSFCNCVTDVVMKCQEELTLFINSADIEESEYACTVTPEVSLRVLETVFTALLDKQEENNRLNIHEGETIRVCDDGMQSLILSLIWCGVEHISVQTLQCVIPKVLTYTADNIFLQKIWTHITKSFPSNLPHTFRILCILVQFYLPCDLQNIEISYSVAKDNIFWKLLQNGITSADPLVRKQALYLMKRAVDHICQNNISFTLHCPDAVFWWNPADSSKIWEQFFLILETLEEKQVHIIRPVLPMVNFLVAPSSEGNVLHVSWLLCVFCRILSHDNNFVVKWGIINFVRIHRELHFVQNGYRILEFLRPFMNAVNNSALYSVNPEHCSPSEIGESLKDLFEDVIVESSNEDCRVFFCCVLDVMNSVSWAPVPLFNVVYALAHVGSIPVWDQERLGVLKGFMSEALRCHYVFIRGAIQCMLLNATINFADFEVLDVNTVADYLGSYRSSESLKRGTSAWHNTVEWIKMLVSKDDVARFVSTSFLASAGQVCLSVTAVARMVVLLCDAKLLPCHMMDGTYSLARLLCAELSCFHNCDKRLYASEAGQNRTLQLVVSLLNESHTTCGDDLVRKTITGCVNLILDQIFAYISRRMSSVTHLQDYHLVDVYITALTSLTAEPDILRQPKAHLTQLQGMALQVLMAPTAPPMCHYFGIRVLSCISHWLRNHCQCTCATSEPCVILQTQSNLISYIVRDGRLNSPPVKQEIELHLTRDLQTLWGRLTSAYLEAGWSIVTDFLHSCLRAEDQLLSLRSVEDMVSDMGTALEIGGSVLLVPVMNILEKMLPKYFGSDMFRLISSCWSMIFELRKTELFWTTMEAFIQMLFQPSVMTTKSCQDHLLQYSDKIFLHGEAVAGLSNVLVLQLQKVVALASPEILEQYCAILVEALTFGPVHRRDQRSEITHKPAFVNETYSDPMKFFVDKYCLDSAAYQNCWPPLPVFSLIQQSVYTHGYFADGILQQLHEVQNDVESMKPLKTWCRIIMDTCRFISSLGNRCSVNDLASSDCCVDNEVRARGVQLLLAVCSSNRSHQVIGKLVDALMLKDSTASSRKTRYFGDSQHHRMKHRVMQSILVVEPLLDTEMAERLMQWLQNSLLVESHQPSVRYQQEWLLARLLYHHSCLRDRLWDMFQQAREKRPGSICSFIAVMYQVACVLKDDQEMFVDRSMHEILPWCMAQHFSVRLYAQTTLQKLLVMCKVQQYDRVAEKYAIVESSLQTSVEHGNVVKNAQKLQEDFYFSAFHPVEHFTLETIFYDLPRLANVTCEEWISTDLLTSCGVSGASHIDVGNSNHLLKQFSAAAWVLKTSAATEDNAAAVMGLHDNVQKKAVPWHSLIPEQDLASKPRHKQEEGLIVVASLIDRLPNLGGLSRTCEVFGVSEYILGSLKYLEDKQFCSLSVTAEQWVPISEVKPHLLPRYLEAKRKDGYTLVGAEQTANSTRLNDFKFPQKTLLLLGNEKEGIPPNLLPLLDVCVEIPQQGVVRSLNVHVTGALFVWEYMRQQVLK